MAQVTSPIILDSTGQQIHSDLQQIKNVLTTPSAAEDITFDNTGTGMQADDVQDAITELKSNLSQLDGLTVYKNLTPQTSYADFDDGSTLPLISLTSNIEPIQDLHGYDNPWAGGAGKNKLPLSVDGLKSINTSGTWSGNAYTLNGITYTIQTDSDDDVIEIKANGTASIWSRFNLSTFNIAVGSYIFSTNNNVPENAYLTITGEGGGFISNSTKSVNLQFTSEEERTGYIGIDANKTVSNFSFKPMIRLSSETDATFAPYSNICPISGHAEANVVVSPTTDAEDGTTYNVEFKDGSNPLTVYGGTLDVVSGELTVDRASVDLGTLYWSYSTADVRFFTTSIKDIKKLMDATIVMNGLCSHYDIVAYQYVHKSTALDGVMGLYSTSTTNYLTIKDTRYTDATSFKTAMDGVQLVYELATPQIYQLTPTQVNSLLGQNYISSDTGNITNVKYIGVLNFS